MIDQKSLIPQLYQIAFKRNAFTPVIGLIWLGFDVKRLATDSGVFLVTAEQAAARIVSGMKQAGINLVATLPDINLAQLLRIVEEDTDFQHVPLCREEEGIGICAGAYLGGKKPAMVMMNAGFLLSANALATVCIHPGIPLLMLIGHSGGVGEENPGHATVGSLTEPVLQAMHIVYEKVGRFDDIRPTIRDSQMLARSSRRPTAIVLNKEALR
jgi:sulfopyruvate decarboxylase subunit alpha